MSHSCRFRPMTNIVESCRCLKVKIEAMQENCRRCFQPQKQVSRKKSINRQKHRLQFIRLK